MSFNQSPSVTTTTVDHSHYIPNFTNEVALFVGYFEKGPINEPVFITDINEFKFVFGRGIDLHHNDWYQVYNYLKYSTGLWVCRTAGNRQYNSSTEGRLLINSKNQFDESYNNISTENGIRFIAQTPGTWGNLLKVAIIYKNQYDENVTLYGSVNAQQTFSYFEEDYIGICVFRKDKLVESYYIESTQDIESTINEESQYVYVKFNELPEIIDIEDLQFGNDSEDLQFGNDSEDLQFIGYNAWYGDDIYELSNGSTNFPTDNDIQYSYNLFQNKEQYDIDIIIGNEKYNQAAVNLAEYRKDSIAFIGVPSSFIQYLKLMFGPLPESPDHESAYSQSGNLLVVNELKPSIKISELHFEKLNKYIATISESQYVHFTLNVKEQLDGFTNKTKLINIAADIAGLKAQASLKTPWKTNAGLERGIIKNYTNIYYNMKQSLLDSYYKKGLNYVQNGVLMTQKTFTTINSSFSRISTRSLFNHMEKETEKLLRNYIFEENTLKMRSDIAYVLKNYLQEVKLNNGIDAGKVEVHPDSSNPNAVIVDIYIKPKYVAEYIQMRIHNTGTNSTTSVLSAAL